MKFTATQQRTSTAQSMPAWFSGTLSLDCTEITVLNLVDAELLTLFV